MLSGTLTRKMIFQIGSTAFDFSERTFIMGVLNVTPDSFSDGGKYFSHQTAVAHALELADAGADIIDIGGESTRPRGMYGNGAKPISADEECRRVLPVIEELKKRTNAVLSIDTYKAAVAERALAAGAAIVNDISGLKFDAGMSDIVARHNATLIIMHIRGTPQTMQDNPVYDNVVDEVVAELQESVDRARRASVEQIIVDPGIGFGKNLQHNLALLRSLNRLKSLDCPIMIGTSRKGFIGTLLNVPVDQRVEGTAASIAVAIVNGANIVRVHDVKEMKRVAVIVDAIMRADG